MAMVIRVRFKRAAKLYDFDPNGLELHNGMSVVTETARGVELGECMSGVMDVPDERLVLPLKPILRIATEQDLAMQKRNEQAEKEAFDIAIDRIAEHKLEMKLVDVEYAFDRSKIIFYFTANGRVDFRMLVKSLASGRPICCRTFLSDFTPVSIKMAKEQNLSLNPTKISGLCDRLMCCLKYEQDHYEQTRKRMPRVGREIITPDGSGVINAINVLEETVRVRIAVGDSFELREYKIDDCQRPGQDERKPRPEEDATAEDAQQAAENAEGGAAETAEPNPPKKRTPGARAETGARPQAGTRPAAGTGRAPAEAGERPETAEKADGQAAGQGSAREGRTAGHRGTEGRRSDRRAGNPRGREEGRPFLKNYMHIITALAVKMPKGRFFHSNGKRRKIARVSRTLTHCGLRRRKRRA